MPLPYQYLFKIAVIGAAGLTLSLTVTKPAQAVGGGLTLGDSSTTQDLGTLSTDSNTASLPSAVDSSIAQIAQTIVAPSSVNVAQVDSTLSADSQKSLSANSLSTNSLSANSPTSSQLVASAIETAPSGSTPGSQAVPEPLTVAGTLLGGAFVWRMRKKLAKNLES